VKVLDQIGTALIIAALLGFVLYLLGFFG